MSSRDPLVAEVLVTAEVSAEEEQVIVDAFRALDVAARTRMVPTRRGLEQLHWLVLATLPLHALLSGLGSAAAQDVTQGLKRLVGRVVGTKHKTTSSAQVLVLQDAVTQLQVVLEADLPSEAYQALVALDLSAFRQGPVHYDRQRGRWRSELDEWQATPGEGSRTGIGAILSCCSIQNRTVRKPGQVSHVRHGTHCD